MSELVSDLDKTITSAVEARVEAEVLRALSTGDFVGRMVTAALQQPMKDPRDSYSREGPKAWIHWLLRDTIQSAAKSAVARLVEEANAQIEGEVRKALRRNLGSIAEALTQNITESSRNGYGVKVDIQLKTRDA